MKTRLGLLTILLWFLLAACPDAGRKPETDPNAPTADFLVGTWEDSEGTLVTFAKVDGQVKLTQIIADDDEEYEVRSFAYQDGRWSFTYHVPSSGYIVTIRFLDTEGDELDADWVNSADDSGSELFTRTE